MHIDMVYLTILYFFDSLYITPGFCNDEQPDGEGLQGIPLQTQRSFCFLFCQKNLVRAVAKVKIKKKEISSHIVTLVKY